MRTSQLPQPELESLLDSQVLAVSMVIKTLVLTDLVGSTALYKAIGDERASELSARHDRLVRDLVAGHDGLEIDKTDGFLILFERPIEGVKFALECHRSLAELSRREGVELRARAAVHLGEVFLRENLPEDVARGAKPLEVEGIAKALAARLMGLAAGGQTLLSHGAFDLARRGAVGSGGLGESLRWLSHGPYLLKGFDEHVEVYEVGIHGQAPLAAPVDTEKARRAVRAGDEITLGWRPAQGQKIPGRVDWRLEAKLGEGGFGDIWLGIRDKTGEKRVFKFCYDAARLRALRREVALFRLMRETLGHRDDIGRILDWNFDHAPYSLELDYSEAGNLKDWAEEEGGLTNVPLEVRLDIVAQIADALAAAHSVGVLHKDVKPTNILISAPRGEPPKAILTDFGIGMLTDDTLLEAQGITGVGVSVTGATGTELYSSTSGTWLYMAPELLAGKAATIQADLYALGVMLYQVVVGDFSRALAPGWERDVENEILREDIADLADREPARRPQSAVVVARKLRGVNRRREERENEVRARREMERSQRLRRLFGSIAAVTTLFLVVTLFMAFRLNEARKENLVRRGQAEALIDFMLFDLRGGLENIGRLDLLAKVAEKAQEYFGSLPDTSDTASLHRYGVGLRHVGDVWLDQGDGVAALESYRAATEIFENLVSRDAGDPASRVDLAVSRTKLGIALRTEGQVDSAIARFQHALAELGPSAGASAVSPPLDPPEGTVTDWATTLARANLHYEIGWTLWFYRGEETARLSFDTALKMAEETAEEAPHEARWRFLKVVVESHHMLGHMHADNQEDLALESYRDALETAQRLAEQEPANLNWKAQVATTMNSIAIILQRRGQAPESLEFRRQAKETYEQMVREDPTNLRWLEGLTRSLILFAAAHNLKGDPKTAIEALDTALELAEATARREPDRVLWQMLRTSVHAVRSRAYLRLGDFRRALEDALAGDKILSRLAARNADDQAVKLAHARHLLLLGRVHERLGESEQARQEWERALDLTAATESSTHQSLRAQALLYLERVEDAKIIVDDLFARGYHEQQLLRTLREKGLPTPVDSPEPNH